MRLLDVGASATLTLVAAPAGYGKTTSVRAWCAGRDAPLAWVTLDAGDNDPIRLWRYVATAIDRARPGLGSRALTRLDVGGGSLESAIDELMNALATSRDDLVLVLDDVQTVVDVDCVASIDYALERLPANAHLVLITRTDPALRLSKLRADGRLVEARARDLAFTAAEAKELLCDRMGIDLGATEVEMLRSKAEGWPAALLLAGLWLRNVDDPHLAAREFRGNHHFVADYLSHEVIGSLDDETRSLLLGLSVLGRFTAEMCDGVLDRAGSGPSVSELERSNLFVTRLERGGWFRMHPLFADFAQFQLSSTEPDAALEIHRRAAAWLKAHRQPAEAAEHAAAAGDHELVARLLVEYHLPLIRGGGAKTLLRWVRELSDHQVIQHPELAVAAATAALMVGEAMLEQRRLLWLADRAQRDHPERFGPYAQAVAAMVRAASVDRDVGRAVGHGRRAVAIAEMHADEVLVAALAGHARALYLAGELDEAWSAALRAVEHPDAERRLPGHAFARSTLALVAADHGWLTAARTHAEKAKSIVGGAGSSRSWLGANAAVALAAVLAAEGNLSGAERELAHAEPFFRDELATVQHAWLLVVVARVRCRRGRLEDAEATLRAARELLAQQDDSGFVPALAVGVETEIERARALVAVVGPLEEPSDAERAVLRLLATDLSVRQIAAELFLSPNTVRSHTRAIYRKLGVNSRAQAVATADVRGLLPNEITHVK
jgi:LuxR family transcriptional regulator, maltose regulon positive regulatory protein